MARLTREEWEQFSKLFEKLEGTNWYDTRELAYMILAKFVDSETERRIREGNLRLTEILQLIYMKLPKK